MEIKVVENSKSINCDLLVVSMFEGEKTSCELANKYAVDEDKFEGKFGEIDRFRLAFDMRRNSREIQYDDGKLGGFRLHVECSVNICVCASHALYIRIYGGIEMLYRKRPA